MLRLHSLLFSTLFLLLAGTLQAQPQFTEMMHDFGTITEGTQAKHIFKFRNVGRQPLTLKKVQASCGCTTPRYTTQEVAPGGEGEIEVTYNSQGRPGDFSKGITVVWSDSASPVVLTIKGTVTAAPQPVQPGTPPPPAPAIYSDTIGNLVFERLRQMAPNPLRSDADQTITFKVRNIGTQAIALAATPPTSPAFLEVTTLPTKLLPNAEGTVLVKFVGSKAKADASLQNGGVSWEIALNTNDALQPKKQLFVFGSFERVLSPEEIANAARLTFERNEIDGGQLISGEKLEVRFKFTNTGGSVLNITGVRASCGCTTPTLADSSYAPGESGEIVAIFNSQGRGTGPQQKTVTVTSNDPTNPNQTLILKCNVITDPFSNTQGAPTAPGSTGSTPGMGGGTIMGGGRQ